ncbi:SAVED domain-containing protein [Pleomorphomonas sp. NRK KF1]|uniref:SAVED domain-containing protein n=1 Tax=Pleomorphomonas sp. NRK KF1 TaxID=2943000 RepID=UPI0020441828|nr:SAVED domain-containing protein [Pleomorphomonas sp. NRK KF1]MCM5554170.1 SAVED domain-containing protein [Pleomorphomonas sp. NRK KF1]
MSNAVEPRWHGDNYQSRFFWIHAASLLDPERQDVVEVTFEADGPKAFDDVVVRYEPGRPSATGSGQVTVDYHQIKWHVDRSGRFGYEDLTLPSFINAKSVSILERLKQAKEKAPLGAAFHLITTDKLKDGDPLNDILSLVDGSLRLQVLNEGKTPASRMGKVRECWRDHLRLSNDDELFNILDGLHIRDNYPGLDFLREQVSLRFRLVGLVGAEDTATFHYDEAAKQLKIKNINRLNRSSFEEWCRSEKWIVQKRSAPRRGISIRTFQASSIPSDMLEALPDCTITLTDYFDGRYLRAGKTWADLKPPIVDFLRRKLSERASMRLFLDAHSSVAFLAGAILGFKTGADVEVVQKGMNNPGQIWDAMDGNDGPLPEITIEGIGDSKDIALSVGLARDPIQQVREYVARSLPDVGTIMHVTPSDGVTQDAIKGGTHAAAIARVIAGKVAAIRKPGGTVHVFVAGPNAFSFLLGQQAESMGCCVPYEFDFGGRVDGSYQPTFSI